MKKLAVIIGLVLLGGLVVSSSSLALAASPLDAIYKVRPDLQAAFDSTSKHEAITGSKAGFLMNMEDWARQYGWQSYAELASYKPSAVVPVRVSTTAAPKTTAAKYVVIDDATGEVLAASKAGDVWPIASITKLMTTGLALDSGLDVGGVGNVVTADEVGGARLKVTSGTKFTVHDLLAATIVASANNAANAVARLTGLTKTDFVTAMNKRATDFGLAQTKFVDPTGIETGNVSTAREVAYFADKAFANENIKHFAGTSKIHLTALNDANYVRDIQSTDWMLFDAAYNDVYVTAGKTGFIDEAGWNAVVQLHPIVDKDSKRSLTVVVLGADSRRDSFNDIASLARSTWKNFSW